MTSAMREAVALPSLALSHSDHVAASRYPGAKNRILIADNA